MERVAASKPFKGAYAKHKRALERVFDLERAKCRETVYKRDGGCCVRCGTPLKLHPSDEGADWYNVANINEIRPRSLGGNPLDPDQCNTLCAECHTGKGHHAP
jgi:5-methylcytosine-specific restriction endonuclease McrA